MNKTLLVFKNEFISTVTRRSFIITLLLVPLITGIVSVVISRLGESTTQIVSQVFSAPAEAVHEGYVDESGLIKRLPEFVPAGRLAAYSNQAEARKALEAGEIESFYVVLPDYIQSGKVLYIRPEFNPISGFDQSDLFRRILLYNLLEDDPKLAMRIEHPLDLEKVNLGSVPQRDQGNMLTFFLPYIVMLLFYIMILSSSGLMLNSVTTEKENRVIEMLMVSINPTQMLTGKIIALGLVGLLQTMVWSGAGLILLRLSGRSLNISSAFQLPTSILAWGALFFLLGYALYASLMAGVGALVPNLREASQATTVVILPMIVPMVLISAIINEPNGGLALGLSLFPFTSPVTMMTRLAAGSVPLWQPVLSAVILALTALLLIRAVAGMFRAQNLLSGQTFKFKTFLKALAGRA